MRYPLIHKAFAVCPKPLKILTKSMFALSPFSKHCPCCSNSFMSFADFDFSPSRYNNDRYENFYAKTICPCCAALPRHRILCRWMTENADRLMGKRLLYFAVEPSVAAWLESRKIAFTSADFFEKADLKLDIQDTGLIDGAYDIIIANHVLEHVGDYKKALQELFRILAPGGFLILSVPTNTDVYETIEGDMSLPREEKIRRFGQEDHLRVFGTSFADEIAEAGFEVSVIDGSRMRGSIAPVTGPADYDVNYLFCCLKSKQ